jgi:Fe-S-cluster containining protein
MSGDDGEPPVPAPGARPVDPDLQRAIEQMIDDVARRPYSRDLHLRLEMLIDLLVARGQLTPGHRRLLHRLRPTDVSTVRLSVFQDKRAVPSSEVDCASLLHLCKGRCCAMDVSLSERDLADRTLTWDPHQPYLLRKDPVHGYCAHHGPDGACTIYDERPGTCRAYDCRQDPRVWIDFEQRLPAPMPFHLVPPDERGGKG